MSWFEAQRIEATNDWIITSNVFFSVNVRILARLEVVVYDGERIATDKGILHLEGGTGVEVEIESIQYAIGDSEEFHRLPFEVHPHDMRYLQAMIEKEADVFLR